MTLKTCLRCDWQGETNQPTCPNCGARPLYVMGASAPEGAGMSASNHPAERSRETASTESKATSGTPTTNATAPASQMEAGRSSGRSARSTVTFVLAAFVLIVALGTWFNAHENRSTSAGSTDTAVTGTLQGDSSASHPTAASSNESHSQATVGGTKRAHVGGSVTLNGNRDGLTMDVRVVKVVDPAKPRNSIFGPKKGDHFIAIRIELTNSGTKTYSTSSTDAVLVIDYRLRRLDADVTDPVGPGLGTQKIAPGERRVGYISFEVPDRRKLIVFQFRLGSGFGPDTGQWSL